VPEQLLQERQVRWFVVDGENESSVARHGRSSRTVVANVATSTGFGT
jgi:hypothetical protein